MIQKQEKRKPRQPKGKKARIRQNIQRFTTKINPTDNVLSPKLWGLGILRQITKGSKTAGFLPYFLIRNPGSFSFAKLGSVPDRVLVRSDIADSKGIPWHEYAGLPRDTFQVDRKNPAKTEKEIREFMQKRSGIYRQIFIVHPLRPVEDYHKMGSVVFSLDYSGKPEILMHESVFVHSPNFRGTWGTAISEKGPLRKKLGGLVDSLLDLGILRDRNKKISLWFVTYKDAPQIPEFYDLLIEKN